MTIEKACRMTEKQLRTYFCRQYQIEEKSYCHECELFVKCNAGCMARRKIANLDKDEFCYMEKAEKPKFDRVVYSPHSSELFVHSSYLCTLIMEPREDLKWESN